MSKDTGGPAFPTLPPLDPETGRSVSGYPFPDYGMTLRDYFAGQVLIGLSIQRKGLCNADEAINAYSLADAMIAERTK